MGSTVEVFPRLELLMEQHNCYTTGAIDMPTGDSGRSRSAYSRTWQDAAPTVSTVVKLELLVRDLVKAAIDSIGQSFYGSPDLIDENSVLPAPRRGHKLLIAVLYTESLAARGVTKRAIGFHTYDPAAAKRPTRAGPTWLRECRTSSTRARGCELHRERRGRRCRRFIQTVVCDSVVR